MAQFVTLPPTTLWITFERGLMWWAFAGTDLIELPSGAVGHGVRARRLIAPWRSTDILGQPLRTETLSGKLTRVAGFRRSLCKVAAADYAVRRINAVASPLFLKAQAAQSALVAVAQEMIGELHPTDFELLVDLVFAHSGWRRVGALGGVQADADLILVQQATGERAFVQVRSRADAGVFADYVPGSAAHSPCGVWQTKNALRTGRGLEDAVNAAVARWMAWRIGRRTSYTTGIPVGLPHLTGFVLAYEIEAEEQVTGERA